MAEGPRIKAFYSRLKPFEQTTIIAAQGTIKQFVPQQLMGLTITKVSYIGKHLWILLSNDLFLRVHFLMYGSMYINEKHFRNLSPRLTLLLSNKTEINFYACSIKLFRKEELKQGVNIIGQQELDITNEKFNLSLMLNHLETYIKHNPQELVCDFLLNQSMFPGVGNILKNEALFACKISPVRPLKKLTVAILKCMITRLQEVANAMFITDQMYQKTHAMQGWKKLQDTVYKIYRKKMCPLCKGAITMKYLGTTHRRTYWCPQCQKS